MAENSTFDSKVLIPKLNDNPFFTFKFWFIRTPDRSFTIHDLLSDDSTTIIGYLFEEPECDKILVRDNYNYAVSDIRNDFNRYKERPEYRIGSTDTSFYTFENQEEGILKYNTLLMGCALIKAYHNTHKDPDLYMNKLNRCFDFLSTTDFYTSPSSRYYHNAYPSGNLEHTLLVALHSSELHSVPQFKYVDYCSSCICALVHDWAKIGLYKSIVRNKKNEKTGKWEQVPSYEYYDKPYTYLGHGVSSMYLAQKYFNLSYDECLAIRFHMGEYNIASNEMNELHNANKYHPIVQLIQFADRLSVVDY